jgi:superfamily II DNA/RNA helicase
MFRHVQTFIEANRDKKIIIFTETKQTAKEFERMDYAPFLTLHGDLEQGQRENRLKRYRDPTSRSILVATDVAARGLDIDDIDVVIQCGCRHIDSFVHRSGRTGRVGKNGLNILFFQPEDLKFVLDLESELNIKINIQQSLVDQVDSDQAEQRVLGDFYKRALSIKPSHQQQSTLYKMFHEMIYNPKPEEGQSLQELQTVRDKMISTLILQYIDVHHQAP